MTERLLADFHVHTALSPCAMDEMTPPAIVAAAAEAGLHMLAICDHNSVANTEAVQQAAAMDGVVFVLAGIEITTCEEVHVVGLFPDGATARAVGNVVRCTLPDATPAGRAEEMRRGFGPQWVMDAMGHVTGEEDKLLSVASGLSLAQTVDVIRQHGGLAVAAHVDRPSYSVVSQLGMFPEDVVFDAIEISAAGVERGRAASFEGLGLPMVASSDSHFLSDVGSAFTVLEMNERSFEELRLALLGRDGRRCSLA